MTGDSDVQAKLRALFLAFIMVTSVFGATIAFSGSAVANQTAVANAAVTEELTVRADNPGESITIEFDVATDSTAPDTRTYNVDVSDLSDAGVSGFSSLTTGDVTLSSSASGTSFTQSSSQIGSDEISFDYTDDGTDNTETITVTIGNLAGTPLDTSDVSPGADFTVSVVDDAGSFTAADASGTINEANIELSSLDASPVAPPVGLDERVDLSVDAEYASDGADVQSSNAEATITVARPGISDITETLNNNDLSGGTFDSATGSDSSSSDGITALIEGSHDISIQAGDVTDGVADNDNSIETTDAFDVEDLRLELETDTGTIAGNDVVTFNNPDETVSGRILRTADVDGVPDVLADDREVNYEFIAPDTSNDDGASPASDAVLTSRSTNNGEFSVSDTFTARDTDASRRDRLDGLEYEVEINDRTTSATDTQVFTTVLDVEFSIDGVDEFDETVQVSGSVTDGQDNPIEDYRVALKPYDENNANPVSGSIGTDDTSSTGSFDFTVVLDDSATGDTQFNSTFEADEFGIDSDALVGDQAGSQYGLIFGTHQVDPANLAAADGNTNEPFVRYTPQPVDPATANIEVEQEAVRPIGFEDTFTVTLTDDDGDPIVSNGDDDTKITVIGEIATDASSLDRSAINAGGAGNVSNVIQTSEVDGGSNTAAFTLGVQDGESQVSFDIEPQSDLEFIVTSEDGTVSTRTNDEVLEVPGEAQSGQPGLFTIDTEADFVGTREFAVGEADPVNILNFDVKDPQTENFDLGDPSAATGAGDTTSIFEDNGPARVDVLPLADDPDDRIVENPATGETFRVGFDGNRDFEGITVYRASFELSDETAADIEPGTADGDLESITVRGAGINETIEPTDDGVARGDNFVAVEEGDDLSDGTYNLLIRPVAVEDADDDEIEITVNVVGEDPVSETVAASGLHASEFRVNGETVDSVEAESLNVTAVLRNEITDDVVNNARIRVTQKQQDAAQDPITTEDLADTDARTSNVNNGEYSFNGIDLGPRGLDTSGQLGIGDTLAPVTFTGYQYADTDDDQALNQNEVNNATVETLELEPTDDLVVNYTEATTPTGETVYAGENEDGQFTLTRGVEYDTLTFRLEDQDGPVDLTNGLGGENVPLNALTDPAETNQDGALAQITVTVDGETVIFNNGDLTFDETASSPADGVYVIDNIGPDDTGLVERNGDVFAFDFESTEGPRTGPAETQLANGTDRGPVEYTLDLETPDRDQTTNTSETGAFVADDPQTEFDIIGVAAPDITGEDFDDLSHDGTDTLNESTESIEQGTIDIDRTYRVNATVSAAHDASVALDGTETDGVFAAYTANAFDDPAAFDGASNFAMVDGVSDVDTGASAVTGILSGRVTGAGGPHQAADEVEIQNADGRFTFDVEVTAPQNTTRLDALERQQFVQLFAFHKGNADAPGLAHTTVEPVHERPEVQVHDQFGADLPRSERTGNQLLAIQPVQNDVLVEVYPADSDDFVLPNGISVRLVGSTAESGVSGDTTFSDRAVLERFNDTQSAQLSITPTGTGDAVIDGRVQRAQAFTVLEGSDTLRPLAFDVRDSNREFDVTVTPGSVTAGQNVTITVNDSATNDPVVDLGEISVTDAEGNVVVSTAESERTDDEGTSTVTIPADAATGTATITIRSAGFAPATVDLNVNAPDIPTATVTFDDKTVPNGTSTITVESAEFGGGEYNIVVHQTTDANGDGEIQASEIGKKIGESEALPNGTATDISVDIGKQVAGNDNVSQLTENQTLVAMLHTTNTSDGDNITHTSPITRDGTPVFDEADVVVSDSGSPLEGTAGQFDDNGDGEITAAELGDAITQFGQEDLSARELGEVITQFGQS